MPVLQMIYKAGRSTFLLVCLFLCTACGKNEAVFVAGEDALPQVIEEAAQPSAEEKETIESAESKTPAALININTANAEELMSLPGIGERKAAAIIEHRQREGEFQTIEEIMNVKGIKTGIFSKINFLICVK